MRENAFDKLVGQVERVLTPEQQILLQEVIAKVLSENLAQTIIARSVQMIVDEKRCRHCGHSGIYRHGRDALGRQRFRCRRNETGGCGRTFNALTGTVLSRMRGPERWAPFANCMDRHLSLTETARQSGVSRTTAFRWRHCLLSVQAMRQSERVGGIVEADETFFRDSFKGSRGWKRGNPPAPRKPRYRGGSKLRGLSREQVPVVTALDRDGGIVERAMPSRAGIAEVLEGRIERGSVLCSDGLAAYHRVAELSGSEHRRIFLPRKDSLDRIIGDAPRQTGLLTLGRVNQHHRTLKVVLNTNANGVGTAYLPNYLGWMRTIRRGAASDINFLMDTLLFRVTPAFHI